MKRFILSALGLVTAAVALGFAWPFGHTEPALKLPGVVETQEVRLGSKVGGRVAEVFVQEGERVVAGQKILRIALPELEAQRAQFAARVAVAKAEERKAIEGPRKEEINEARAGVAALSARLARMNAGHRPEEIDQVRNERAAAEADFLLATQEFQRVQSLTRQGGSSRTDAETAIANRNRTQSRLNAADAHYRLMQKGFRDEEIAEAAAEVARGQAKLDLLLAGSRESDIDAARATVREWEAKLAEVDANLAEATVTAPEACLVEVLPARAGTIVAPNQPVARVLRTGDRWVRVYVPSTELGKVRVGQKCAVTCDSYPGRVFEGEVVQIGSAGEFTPRNVQSIDGRENQVFGAKVRVDDPDGVFKAGMYAEVVLK